MGNNDNNFKFSFMTLEWQMREDVFGIERAAHSLGWTNIHEQERSTFILYDLEIPNDAKDECKLHAKIVPKCFSLQEWQYLSLTQFYFELRL